MKLERCDVLFLGPHPDDVEIAASGTILRLVAAGRRVSVLDLTRGEMGSRGTAAERAQEAAAAARELGLLARHNLGLPDTGLRADDAAAVGHLVEALRSGRPHLLFAPLDRDVHPDHVAAADLAARAFFLAGLRHHAPGLGAAFRPRLCLRYAGNVPAEPTFCVDIGDLVAAKERVLRCYASQLRGGDAGDHFVQGLDILERARVRDRFHGARIGRPAAEPFLADGPLPLRDLASLMA